MDWTNDNTFFEFPTYGCNGFQDELDCIFGTSCEWPWSTVAQESILDAVQSSGDAKVPSIQDDKLGSSLLEQQQLSSSNIWNVNQVDSHYAPGMGLLDFQQQEYFESSGEQHSLESHLEFNQRRECDHDHDQLRFYDGHLEDLRPKTLWCGDHDNRLTVTNEHDQVYLPTMTTSIAAPISAPVPPPTYSYAREQYCPDPDPLSYNLCSIRDFSGVNNEMNMSLSDISARPNHSIELNGVDLLKFDTFFTANQSVPQFDHHPMEMAIQLRLQGTLQLVEKPSYLNDEIEIESPLRDRSIADLQNLTGCFQHCQRDSSVNSVAPVTPIMSREMNKKNLTSEVPHDQVAESGGSREELEVSSSLSSLSPSTVESEAAIIQNAVARHRKVIDWAYEKEVIVLCMLGKQDADDPSHSVLHEELQLIIDDFQSHCKNAEEGRVRPSEERSLRNFRRRITTMVNTYCGRIKRRVRYLPEFCKDILSEWVSTDEHQENPYPSKDEIRGLAKELGLTSTQVEQWFENYRVRYWKPSRAGIRKGKFFRYPPECTAILRTWISHHKDEPNPRRGDLRTLVQRTGMTAPQIKQWCYNYRRRHLKSSL